MNMTASAKNIIISKLLQINSDSVFEQIAGILSRTDIDVSYIYHESKSNRYRVICWKGGKKYYIGSSETKEGAEKIKHAYETQYRTITIESSL